MRFLIVGAGGLGTVLAGFLARAGEAVTLFVKPEHAAALEHSSVRITGAAEFATTVRFASVPDGLGPFDYLIICVKGRDTEAALAQLRDITVDTVLSVQNGVVKDERLVAVFGSGRVLGAVSAVAGALQTPGVALHPFAGRTLVGELDGRRSERAERLAGALNAAGLPAACVLDIREREWYKLAAFLRTALVCAIVRRDIASVALLPDLARICARVALEVAAVAEAERCPVWRFPPSLAGLGTADPEPDAALDRRWSDSAVLAGLVETGREFRRRGAVVYPSLAQDVIAARSTELESTAGDALARAARHDVAVPTLHTCTGLLRGLA